MGLNHPALRSAECHWTSGWPGVIWSTLSALVSSGRIAGWSWSRISAPAIVLAQDRSAVTCSLSHAVASVLVHHQVSRVVRLVLQREHRHVWVVRHLRSHQQGGAAGESTGPGLARPHLRYHPLGLELRLFRRSGALVVPRHQPYRHRRMGPWAQKLGPRHIRVRFLVLAVREYGAEDVQEGRRWVVCRPLRGGGQTAPTAVAPDVEVQAVRSHPWASVGVLLSPRGVDEPQAGVPRPGGVEKVDQSVAPTGVVGGLLFAAAVVEVLIGALVEAFPHHRRPRDVVVGEGVVRPVVPMQRRRVWHRQAARVAVPQLGGA